MIALAELAMRHPQQVIAVGAEARRLVRDLRRQLTAGIGTPRREARRGPRPREHSARSEPSRGPPDGESELPSTRLDRFSGATRLLSANVRARIFVSLPTLLQRPFWSDDLSDKVERDRVNEMHAIASYAGLSHISDGVEGKFRRLLEGWSQ